MKKLFTILFVILGLNAFAQEAMTEGVIKTKTTMSSPNAEVNAQFAMIGDILSVTYFKDGFTRTETSNVMTGNSVAVIDSNAKEMLMYMDNMAGKVYMKNSYEPSEEDLKDITVEKTGETKDILGYSCAKYVTTISKNGATVKMDIYATDKLAAVSNQTTSFGDTIKGYPLLMEMKMNQGGMDMVITMEVTEIKKESVSSDKFDLTPPDGYKQVDKLGGM
ncbi:MAG: DUF4412 domain-containing protein [Flavobacteriaceae bacterium]|nr:DUF4412 domain-containing protein [Mangrovimonas sp.]MCB0433055.1 DUF4412 domain-containing protein [Mangrovimonas sp.]MCB0469627.1 DUF4412 domain-containing protein [Flavobacteriaceae bacterium]HPF96088.1 DUF4412 domain-containing protein [Mangrovimonas sp.]